MRASRNAEFKRLSKRHKFVADYRGGTAFSPMVSSSFLILGIKQHIEDAPLEIRQSIFIPGNHLV